MQRIIPGTCQPFINLFRKFMKPVLAILLIFLLFISCYKPRFPGTYIDFPYQQQKVMGYRAVYSQDPELLKVSFMPPQEMKRPGKIYVMGNMILQNDIGSGIHVFNKTNPSQLSKHGFIRINGNHELSVKQNHI